MQYLTREERLIKLEKMPNTRDLGGYETQDGYYTKVKRYIRASSPARATQEDLKKLEELGVNVVIDLRSAFETEKETNPYKTKEGVTFYGIDLLQMKSMNIIPDEVREFKGLGGLYIYMLESGKEEIKEVFDIFLSHPYDTILYHCSAGKDRTGVISALLLDLAGCHDYDIIKDYSESYENNLEINEFLASQLEDDKKQFLDSAPEYMMIFLGYLREHYGSSKNYLMHIGFTEDQVNDLIEDFVI